jgi:hypothetical protein
MEKEEVMVRLGLNDMIDFEDIELRGESEISFYRIGQFHYRTIILFSIELQAVIDVSQHYHSPRLLPIMSVPPCTINEYYMLTGRKTKARHFQLMCFLNIMGNEQDGMSLQ